MVATTTWRIEGVAGYLDVSAKYIANSWSGRRKSIKVLMQDLTPIIRNYSPELDALGLTRDDSMSETEDHFA